MATKSYKLRLDFRDHELIVDSRRFKSRAEEVQTVQRWLDDTREAFNKGVDYLTGWLLIMHRGAGIFREKKDGIWREWEKITTITKLESARNHYKTDPALCALIENHKLLFVFKDKGKTEADAVKLAECCRRIAEELCPPGEDGAGAQMPRDDFDLLTNSKSTAKNIRSRGTSKTGMAKKVSGKRPGWMLEKALCEEAKKSSSLDALISALAHRDEFRSAKKDGQKKIAALKSKYDGKSWGDIKLKILEEDRSQIVQLVANVRSLDELCNKLSDLTLIPKEDVSKLQKKWRKRYQDKNWEEASKELQSEYRLYWEIAKEKAESKRNESAKSGAISAYEQLLKADCLPLPNFALMKNDGGITLGSVALGAVDSEWKRAMWNMAGQRVRSHLGWVRRRADERLVWNLLNALFERGGWIRIKRREKKIKKEDLKPEDIRFIAPNDNEISDFMRQDAYAGNKWVTSLKEYELNEMPKHLEGVAFGAAEQQRIRNKTAKGWSKIHEKWINLIKKSIESGKSSPSTNDLIEALNEMRSRKSREFGDQRLFEWLAVPDRRWLWDNSDKGNDNNCGRNDRDCISAFIAHNERLADKPESITFTRSDSIKHPVWPYFGENSAVKYRLVKEEIPERKSRLLIVLKQLLSQQIDGSYAAVDNVKIALRGYDDFEKSFVVPSGSAEISPKQQLVFRDDLLGGKLRNGTLSGMKLTWEREELEAQKRKYNPTKVQPRIYANFSCDAGTAIAPKWLIQYVGSDVKLEKPRDGMTRVFFLKKTITKESPDQDSTAQLPPGARNWPKEAIENGLMIRGTDLGYRTSSAGAWWRLSLIKNEGQVAWRVGECGGQPVYALLERTAAVSLPGDGESLPPEEQTLRERLYSLRPRLNLNNTLLRLVRLLTLESVTVRRRIGEKIRKRTDGTSKHTGVRWKTETKTINAGEIKDNCQKASEQLLRWSATDAMTESLKAIGYDRSLWDWLSTRDVRLNHLALKLPKTDVPSEKEAKERRINREALKNQRVKEDAAFAQAVYDMRISLAKALCDDYDTAKQIRVKSGLWAEFDRALLREISYSDRGDEKDRPKQLATGLFRLLRKPPITKHNDRKDEVNNLPHGKTYRGGLSMQRLNFLDDVKNFVRRWSCRSRWPGDIRRISKDEKFDRCDTEHLDHLREHRAKLIAHSDIAQTLGFNQDLRRGLWQFCDTSSGELLWHCPERGHFYRENNDKLIQCAAPDNLSEKEVWYPHPVFNLAHVLVYEDLTRYKMRSDRPKNENAGLARWSHRRILSFAQHVGGLFGVQVATVDARFSSRYCSYCGAPGYRTIRFDPAWLNQSWMKKILQSGDIRDAAMKGIACRVYTKLKENPHEFDNVANRPWVLRDGGTHFVCANSECPVHCKPINADENAAANIGLRFLRGVDAIRIEINSSGKVVKNIGYMPNNTVLTRTEGKDGDVPFWIESNQRNGAVDGVANESTIDEDEQFDERYLFRDPSGVFLCNDYWFAKKDFWGKAAKSCASGIKATNASQSGLDSEDSDD
ncbi:MAG TPA: type V CRISPR-associated protein Cas12b [Phycisphaerae bacterium]|nr:type V CRISPR-associated protein Cas12b [Phycisphaerae bacterium]